MNLEYDNPARKQNERIKVIQREYKRLILTGKYKEAEDLERKEGYLEITLNAVISKLILSSENEQKTKLVNAFRHRGYGDSWLDTRIYDPKKNVESLNL